MNCTNCHKRLPLIIGRKKRIKAFLFREDQKVGIEFCSEKCGLEFANKIGAVIYA